jgi:hypothetical protein
MFSSGLIDQETALHLLYQGEVLGDSLNIEEIMSRAENQELHDIDMQVQRTEAMAEIGEGTPAADDNLNG